MKQATVKLSFILIIGVAVIFGGSTSALAAEYPGSNVTAKSGHILFTNDSVVTAFIGHSAIVVDGGNSVVEIAGKGESPQKISLSKWFTKHPSTQVGEVQYQNEISPQADDAAAWAESYVNSHPNATYKITNDLYSLDPTYCSKLVWQAYAFGADYKLFDKAHITPADLMAYNNKYDQVKVKTIYDET